MGIKLTLAMPIFNKAHWIGDVLRSWLDHWSGKHSLELVLVFDTLRDESDKRVAETMRAYPGVDYHIAHITSGYECKSDNLALDAAAGEIIVFAQDDNWIHDDDWDIALVDVMEQVENVGAVALLAGGVFEPDGIYHRVEVYREHKTDTWQHGLAKDAFPPAVYAVDFVARPLAVYTEIARAVGGFDAAVFYPMDWDETDFSMRLWRAGYQNIYVPFDLVNPSTQAETRGKQAMTASFLRNHASFMLRHREWIAEHGSKKPKALLATELTVRASRDYGQVKKEKGAS